MHNTAEKFLSGQEVYYLGEKFNIIAVSIDQSKLVLKTDMRTIIVNSKEVAD